MRTFMQWLENAYEVRQQAVQKLDQWIEQPQVKDMLMSLPDPAQNPGFKKFISQYSYDIQKYLTDMLRNHLKYYQTVNPKFRVGNLGNNDIENTRRSIGMGAGIREVPVKNY